MRNYRIGLSVACIAIAGSVWGLASDIERFESCYDACNGAWIVDSLQKGEIEDEDYATQVVKQMKQETMTTISPICTEEDFKLMADALCHSVENSMCKFGFKILALPPFWPARADVPASFLEMISGRRLSDECLQGYPR